MKFTANRVVIGVLAVALVGATGAAVYYASQARTPAQAAAETAEPDDSVITVPVETGRIAAGIRVDGAITPADVIEISAPAEVAGADLVIASDVPLAPGDEVKPGSVVLEVSGRPMIALPGDVPAYRGLTEGDRGKDVTQLQKALSTIYGTPASGVFDDRTAADVRRLYSDAGYTVAVIEDVTEPTGDADDEPDVVERVTVPVGEIAFLPSFPARVGTITAVRGRPLEGIVMTITAGAFRVEAVLTPRELDLFTDPPKDARVEFGIGPWAGGKTTFDRVERRPLGDGGEPVDVGVFTVDASAADPRSDDRQEIVLVTEESAADALIVPLSAVWTDGSGRSTVTVATPSGATERHVQVDIDVTSEGRAAIDVLDGHLEPGELVVVGWRDRANS